MFLCAGTESLFQQHNLFTFVYDESRWLVFEICGVRPRVPTLQNFKVDIKFFNYV